MVYQMEQAVPMLIGEGAINVLGEKLAQEYHASKVALVCDPNVKKAGIAEKIERAFQDHGLSCVVYDKIERDAPDHDVDELGRLIRGQHCDAIVAVGGGSTMDAAKGAGIVACNGGSIRDYMVQRPARLAGRDSAGEFNKPPAHKQDIPLIVIPTTSGTGSEMRLTGIIHDTDLHVKDTVVYVPKLAIQDPQLHTTMPAYVTATTAFDALAHATEGMTSLMGKDKLRTAILGAGINQAIFEWLPTAIKEPGNLKARENLAVASSLAGLCSLDGFAHIGHNTADTLTYNFDIPHAHGCALQLPAAVELAAPYAAENVRHIAIALGLSLTGTETPETLGAMVGDQYRKLAHTVGIPSLQSLGVKREQLLVPKVIDDMFLNQRMVNMFPSGKGITRDEAEWILTTIYDKYE